MKKIAIFPGSFDPFTLGHAAVVKQALCLFDKIIIAVGINSAKSGLLTKESRLALIGDIYADEDRVEVSAYEGLTIDFARQKGAVAVVRGVRSTIDFEYERSLAAINARLDEEIVTVVLYSPAELADISSNVVRELYSFGRNVDDLLPEGVEFEKYVKKI